MEEREVIVIRHSVLGRRIRKKETTHRWRKRRLQVGGEREKKVGEKKGRRDGKKEVTKFRGS